MMTVEEKQRRRERKKQIDAYYKGIDQQRRAALDAADAEWRGMILLGYQAGMRLSDASHLKWSNIDGRRLTFEARKTSRGKKSKRKTVTFLHDDLLNYIASYRAVMILPRRCSRCSLYCERTS